MSAGASPLDSAVDFLRAEGLRLLREERYDEAIVVLEHTAALIAVLCGDMDRRLVRPLILLARAINRGPIEPHRDVAIAIDTIERARRIATAGNHALDVSLCDEELGTFLERSGRREEALKAFDAALNGYRRLGDREREYWVSMAMRDTLMRLQRYAEALPHARRVASTSSGGGATKAAGLAFLGRCLAESGAPAEAIPILEQALEILRGPEVHGAARFAPEVEEWLHAAKAHLVAR